MPDDLHQSMQNRVRGKPTSLQRLGTMLVESDGFRPLHDRVVICRLGAEERL